MPPSATDAAFRLPPHLTLTGNTLPNGASQTNVVFLVPYGDLRVCVDGREVPAGTDGAFTLTITDSTNPTRTATIVVDAVSGIPEWDASAAPMFTGPRFF